VSSIVTEGGVVGVGRAEAVAEPGRLLDEFLEWLRESSAETTVRTYRTALADFVRRMDVRDLRDVNEALIERYLGRLFLARLSESTRQLRGQSAPRKLFRWIARRGHVPADPTKELPPMRVRFMERIPVLTRGEIARLTFRAAPAPPPRRGRREPREFFDRRLELHNLVELRDRVLLALIYDVPLRGGEPSLLERRDYDELRGEIDVRGSKWQSEPFTAPLLEPTKVLMALYLEALRRSRWNEHPALFPPLGVRRADSKHPAFGIGPFEVYRILKKRVALAGLQARGRRISPHSFGRYSRATHWKEEGVPLDEISALLRHKRIETTRRYVRLGPVKSMKRRADRANLFRRPDFVIPPE
jgi:site-specific recombinase XerD